MDSSRSLGSIVPVTKQNTSPTTATDDSTQPREPNRRPGARPLWLGDISWVRAIAAIEVVVWHSDLVTKYFVSGRVTTSGYKPVGAIGVEIFFVLSGYVMCMRASSYRTGTQYLLARLVRLVPMYWIFTSAVVLAYCINSKWHLGNFDLSAFNLIRSYFMIPEAGFPILGVGWTLEYEMVFYITVALLSFGGHQLTSIGKLAPLGVVMAFGLGGLLLQGDNEARGGPADGFIGHILSPYMLTFAGGWLIRLVEDTGGLRRNWRLVVGVVAIVVLGLSQATPNPMALGFRALMAMAVFLIFRTGRSAFQVNNLVNRTARLWGDASYSLYLSHWFVLSIFGKVLSLMALSSDLALPMRIAGIVFSIGVGIAVYLLLERPIDRYLRVRLVPARAAARTTGAASAQGLGPPPQVRIATLSSPRSGRQ